MLLFCSHNTDSLLFVSYKGRAAVNFTHKQTLIAQSRMMSPIMNNTQQSACD